MKKKIIIILLLIMTEVIFSAENQIQLLINKGNEALKNEQYKEAIDDFTGIIKLDYECKEAYLFRGIAKAKWGNVEDAKIDFDTAIKIDKAYKEAYFARAYYGSSYDDVIKDYKKTISLDSEDVDAYYYLGTYKLEKTLSLNSKFGVLNTGLHMVGPSRNQFDYYMSFPKDMYPRVYSSSGINEKANLVTTLQEIKKNFDVAINLLKTNPDSKYLNKQKYYKDIYYLRGIINYLLRDYKSSIEDIIHQGDIIENYPGVDEKLFYYKKAYQVATENLNSKEDSVFFKEKYEKLTFLILREESVYENKLEVLNALIEKKPNLKRAYLEKAMLIADMETNKPFEIIENFNKAIELDSKYVKAYIERGKYRASVNKKDEALKDLAKALELEPENQEIVENIKKIENQKSTIVFQKGQDYTGSRASQMYNWGAQKATEMSASKKYKNVKIGTVISDDKRLGVVKYKEFDQYGLAGDKFTIEDGIEFMFSLQNSLVEFPGGSAGISKYSIRQELHPKLNVEYLRPEDAKALFDYSLTTINTTYGQALKLTKREMWLLLEADTTYGIKCYEGMLQLQGNSAQLREEVMFNYMQEYAGQWYKTLTTDAEKAYYQNRIETIDYVMCFTALTRAQAQKQEE